MVDKNQYQKFLRAKIKGAVEEARAASTLTHQGVKGTVLEILISKLFRPLLPSDIGVGTGQIIEQYRGLLSNQVDIVLYDRSILPPALYDESVGIFPVEAVLYAIEIKTTLTAQDLARAHDSALSLSKFAYTPGLTDVAGNNLPHSIEKVRSTIFALSSDLSGNDLTEAQRYEKIYGSKKDYPHIRAICVAGREYWYDDGEYWIGHPPVDEFDEILGFLGGVTNTYRYVAQSRHYPKLGNYIVPEIPVQIGPKTGEILRIPVTCEKCGKNAEWRPFSTGVPDIIFTGVLRSENSCPNCGGTMVTDPGRYEFKQHKLFSATKHSGETNEEEGERSE